MKRFRFTLILSCVLLLFFASSADAEFKRNYTQAKKSFEDGNFAAAVKKLQDAISDNPDSAARIKIYGMRYDSYIPHYYLGESYFKLNDCASAVAAWNQALQVGVIQGLPEYGSMQANMASCQTDVVEAVDVSKIAAQADSAIGTLETANRSFSGLENESLLKREWASKWKPELTRSQQLAGTLKQRLGTATADHDPDAIQAIINEARSGASTLTGSEKLAKAQINAIRSQGAEAERVAREKARNELQETTRLAKTAEQYDGSNSQMNSLHADLQRQIGVAKTWAQLHPRLTSRSRPKLLAMCTGATICQYRIGRLNSRASPIVHHRLT
jgi:tetratricopeptide (TPR) repeat protein